jgi:hypothetical protein
VQSSRNHPIDCGTATDEFSRTNPKQNVSERSINVSIITETQASNAETTLTTIGDTNYFFTPTAIAGTNKRVLVESVPEKFNRFKAAYSSDSAILSQSATDPLLFEYQSSGQVSLTVEMQDGETVTQSVESSRILSSNSVQSQEFVSGTLGYHLNEEMARYANGSTQAPGHYALYSVYSPTTNQYTRNADHWLASLDFSGTMVNKIGSAGVTRVTAITRHHAIGATHYGPEVNDVIQFLDGDGQIVSRTVISLSDLGGGTDCRIVRFNEALPESVKTYKTLPSSYLDYSPPNYIQEIVNFSLRCHLWPAIYTSHYRWDSAWPLQRTGRFAYARRCFGLYTQAPTYDPVNSFSAYPDRGLPSYNGGDSGIGGGDSGGPAFFIINGELVLFMCFLGSGGGPFHPSFLSQIQAALDTLGPGGQTYQTVDLSEFTNFAS